jgi:hypothetical protein
MNNETGYVYTYNNSEDGYEEDWRNVIYIQKDQSSDYPHKVYCFEDIGFNGHIDVTYNTFKNKRTLGDYLRENPSRHVELLEALDETNHHNRGWYESAILETRSLLRRTKLEEILK